MVRYQKISPALILPSPALIVSLPAPIVSLSVKSFPNKLSPKVPNKIPRNHLFSYFTSCLIVSLMPFINNPDFSRELAIFFV